MHHKNYIKEKLKLGKAVIGTWAIIPSSIVTDIIASTNIDFVIIDAEHGPITFETAQEMVIACESRNVSPIMRVGGVIESEILRALDIGAHGIQIPNVQSKSDVERIIKFSKYPPIGNRGFSPFTRAGNYSIESSTSLTKNANKNNLIGINVEGKEAIDNIDEILKIEALDIIFIGLFDLSKSLGIPGKVKDKKVINLLKNLTNKINKAGKYPGTIATCEKDLIKYKKMGLKYILYLVDCEMLRNSYSSIVTKFKSIN